MRPERGQQDRGEAKAKGWRPTGKLMVLVAVVALALATHGQIFMPVIRGLYLANELLYLRDAHNQLGADNASLAGSAAYLKTDEGRELAARSELGALQPGERVLVIRSQQDRPQPSPPSLPQRLHRWLGQRWADANRSVEQAIAAVQLWIGVGRKPLQAKAGSATKQEDSSPG